MDNTVLYKKLNSLPDSIKGQVIDFIEFLLKKNTQERKPDSKKPQFGSAKGMFKIKKGFDDPIEDFKEYM